MLIDLLSSVLPVAMATPPPEPEEDREEYT